MKKNKEQNIIKHLAQLSNSIQCIVKFIIEEDEDEIEQEIEMGK